MKNLIILSLLLIFPIIISLGQFETGPIYFLNSKPFDWNKVFINPSRIDSIRLNRDVKNGEIYVLTKNKDFTFYRLSDILLKYTSLNDVNIPIVYRINGKMIQDTAYIKIDDTYYM